MRFGDLVATSEAVAGTPARSAKVACLADLLRRLEPAEVAPAVSFLCGKPRQGSVQVGWATLRDVTVDPAPEPTLSVLDVDSWLDDLLGIAGQGSAAARRAHLRTLLSAATAPEADFVRRLLMGELRQGALAGIVTDAVAKAAGVSPPLLRRACMLAGDLPATAEVALTGGAAGLEAVGMQVLRPVLPMLASTSASAGAAVAELGRCAVEWKLDGARIQAHKRGDEVRLFTRNQHDVTDRLPGIAEVVRRLSADQAVLDAEVLGVADDERPDRFQESMSRFSRHDGAGASLGIWFFDVLHVDGTDVLDRPLVERAELLRSLVGPLAVPSVVTDEPEVADAFLADAVAAGHEGVMVKAATSPYEAGRRGKAWRKVKPVRTLDLVVLGAEWGHGRRQGWLSNLHLGARDGDRFVMVGKTFKGLTDELLRWQTDRFLELETSREGIVVLVRPEVVVEIALDSAMASPRYPGGVSLRFARVKRYRPDKSPDEADTLHAVRALLP